MTPRQQHLQDLCKTVTGLGSALLAAIVGFFGTVGPDKIVGHTYPPLVMVVIVFLIVAVCASLVAMHLLSNRLVDEPKMGPEPMFAAANVALYAFLFGMFFLGVIGLVALI